MSPSSDRLLLNPSTQGTDYMNILTVSGRRIGLRSGVGLAALALATPAFAQAVKGSTD